MDDRELRERCLALALTHGYGVHEAKQYENYIRFGLHEPHSEGFQEAVVNAYSIASQKHGHIESLLAACNYAIHHFCSNSEKLQEAAQRATIPQCEAKYTQESLLRGGAVGCGNIGGLGRL